LSVEVLRDIQSLLKVDLGGELDQLLPRVDGSEVLRRDEVSLCACPHLAMSEG
jgi:hypothetical protein